MLSENWVNACIQVPGMLDSTGSGVILLSPFVEYLRTHEYHSS
jgi:hypothetical protein